MIEVKIIWTFRVKSNIERIFLLRTFATRQVIDLPVQAVIGVLFRGSNQDVLIAITGAGLVYTQTASLTNQTENGIYYITNLNATAFVARIVKLNTNLFYQLSQYILVVHNTMLSYNKKSLNTFKHFLRVLNGIIGPKWVWVQ